MNETEYQFLILQNAINELKFDVSIFPGKVDKDIKKIKEILNWVERHHLPIGISKAMMARLKDKTIYASSEKGKNAIAFQIHNIIKRPAKRYELVGIKITFGTSENGVPGLTFEGTRENPVMIEACDLPWMTPAAEKTPKKFEEWLNNHIIEPNALSEKVEKFALIDIGLVEMKELGLGEPDYQGMKSEDIEKEKAKKNFTAQTPPLKPVENSTSTTSNKGSEVGMTTRRSSPMYPRFGIGMTAGMINDLQDEEFNEQYIG